MKKVNMNSDVQCIICGKSINKNYAIHKSGTDTQKIYCSMTCLSKTVKNVCIGDMCNTK